MYCGMMAYILLYLPSEYICWLIYCCICPVSISAGLYIVVYAKWVYRLAYILFLFAQWVYLLACIFLYLQSEYIGWLIYCFYLPSEYICWLIYSCNCRGSILAGLYIVVLANGVYLLAYVLLYLPSEYICWLIYRCICPVSMSPGLYIVVFAKWVYLLTYILLFLPSQYIIVVFPDPDKRALLPTPAIQIAFIMFHIINFINLYQNTFKPHLDCFICSF